MINDDMMTVAAYAAQQGVTAKTIYKRLNRVIPFHPEGITLVKNGKTYITAFGQVVLTEGITQVTPHGGERVKKGNTGLNPGGNKNASEVAFLRIQNEQYQAELAKEREHSRAMAGRVADLATQLAELSRNNQLLLGAEQTRTNPALLPAADKPSFFRRIFGRKE